MTREEREEQENKEEREGQEQQQEQEERDEREETTKVRQPWLTKGKVSKIWRQANLQKGKHFIERLALWSDVVNLKN